MSTTRTVIHLLSSAAERLSSLHDSFIDGDDSTDQFAVVDAAIADLIEVQHIVTQPGAGDLASGVTVPEQLVGRSLDGAVPRLPIDLITATVTRAQGVLQIARDSIDTTSGATVSAAIDAAISLIQMLVATLAFVPAANATTLRAAA